MKRWRHGVSLFCVWACCAGGCVQSTLEPASDANLTPRDKKLLANAPYAQATIPQPYQRHIVSYHRKETAGTIVVDSDARYLYYVLPEGKAIRYGITVGEDALAFSGVAKVGRKEEWPSWTPTTDIKKRLGNIPAYVAPGPHNPMGSRALYVYRRAEGHALSHPRHQPAGIHRLGDLVGLHPPDQRGRDRPVQPGQDRHAGGGAGAGAGRLAEQSADRFHGRTRRQLVKARGK